MKQVRIPRHIDEPPHFLLWSADEVAPMMLGLTIGVVIGQALICTLIGFSVTHIYKKYRDSHPDGFLYHKLYWWGFTAPKSRIFTNPYIKKFLP